MVVSESQQTCSLSLDACIDRSCAVSPPHRAVVRSSSLCSCLLLSVHTGGAQQREGLVSARKLASLVVVRVLFRSSLRSGLPLYRAPRVPRDVPIHVDAASGGFIAPFVTPQLVWDFRCVSAPTLCPYKVMAECARLYKGDGLTWPLGMISD